ncbi:LysR family transcriptional regulator [Aminobacter carboxidus]|uniref:LysR family glycine cleavage system transcriptional activator n=1 Tax=Aminobacter carboxidus TaxID=376165 RepID=A0A8E1WD93_9HYPH|nr:MULTISPECIES: LysR family transcriptional regulator [Aminobacter carboxidus group]MBB6466262.1 LysR family glycine cleavage system transcriptional activator [Aminobacter lissarensis]MBE1203354.1 LysR family transcriptional regulator [Aminobacter carboxidus]
MRRSYVPTIAELEAFRACASLGTTIRAADQLGLTQSSVSRSIGQLEDRLGVALFHRVRQRLALSDAGRRFARDAETILDALHQAAVRTMAFGGQSDVLSIAVLPTLADRWLIPRLAGFHAAHQQVAIDLAVRLEMVDLETEPFDAAIQRGPAEPGQPGVVRLFDEELVVVASPTLLDGRAALDDAELAALPLLQQSTRPTLWLQWFQAAGIDPRTTLRGHRFEQFSMVVEAAVAGLGVALVPEVLAERELASGRLVMASPNRLAGEVPYRLAFRPGSEDRPGLREFVRWLTSEAQPVRS